MNNSHLENCPCCGGEAAFSVVRLGSIYDHHYGQIVVCSKCGLRTNIYGNGCHYDINGMRMAAEAWNRRAS